MMYFKSLISQPGHELVWMKYWTHNKQYYSFNNTIRVLKLS